MAGTFLACLARWLSLSLLVARLILNRLIQEG
jgi:hypothetical protein